jgi:type I restriction enzyme S subunit
MKVKLREIAEYVNIKINSNNLSLNNYISTENMLPDRKGISMSSNIPNNNVNKFLKNDILISNIRPYFKKIWFAIFEGGASNDILVIRGNNKVNSKYLYYLLSTDDFFDYNVKGSKGTKMPRGDKEHIMNYEFKLPSLKEQKRIADILTALDDKIELNNQMNQTLEEIASLLYKRWFVDFEFPDDKGNPYKSSGGEMVDSELGMIPKGWEVKELGEISEKIITGKTPSTKDSKNFGEGTPFITIPDMYRKVFTDKTVRHITNYGRKKIQNKLIPKNSVLVSCIATPGLVSITSKESITNQQINSIVCKKQNLYFIYETLLSLKEYIILLGSGGSTTLNLNKSDFSKISICYAENRINKVFYELCDYIFNQIYENQFEIIKLENMKEELLKELL